MLKALFAREGRVSPYNKFLSWELANHLLADLPWSAERFLELMEAVIQAGDMDALRELFTRTRDTSLELGSGRAIGGWSGVAFD